MKKILTIITIVFATYPLIAQEKIKGHFDAVEVLNEYLLMDSVDQMNYKETLSNLNIPLIEDYLGLLGEMRFEEADSLIHLDDKLKNIPERAIAISYTFYFAYQNNLIDLYALCCLDEEKEMNVIVYMTEKSFVRYSKKLEQELTMKVELIQEIPLTKTLLYRLK